MKKNGRTFAEDMKLVCRGILEFDKILPGQLKAIFAKSILVLFIPYIAVVMSAMIIDELTGGQSREKLLIMCITSVVATGIFSMIKHFVEAKVAVGYSHLFSAHEIILTDKAHRLPYELIESSRVRELRDKVSGSISVSGAGMASLYWDMEVVFTNIIAALISCVLCADFLKEIVVLPLIIICAYISCKMTSKRFDVSFELFKNGAKYNRYGEFYTLNYLQDENAALDVRMFGQKRIITEESQKMCYEHFAKGKQKEMQAVNKYDGTKLICSCLCGAAVYLVVGNKALAGDIGAGSIIVTYSAVTMLIAALGRLAEIITDLRNNNEHLINYFEYMDLPEADEAAKEADAHADDGRGIELRNVSFKYPESDSLVLRDVSLVINVGERLAIVGENGSGKTTLIKLICRLYKPTEGVILLNGRDIWSYSYAEYIKSISTVFQDFALFSFSLAENIAAADYYDGEHVKEAIAKAGLGAKLEQLQNGIRQNLFHDFEENGTDLSGGEAQKAAIARAVYKDSDIMILDEPTAAFDPYAEYDIYKNFHNITADKTVFSISHRLSSCRMCDRVVVMDRGRLVQCGTHAKLVEEKSGKYYEMWMAQAEHYV